MAKYINLGLTKDAIYQAEANVECDYGFDEENLSADFIEGVKAGLVQAIEILQEEPIADVAPVIHASWEVIRYDKSNIFDYSFKCSRCKGETPREGYPISPDFCPICGAKMDGGDKNARPKK